MSKSETITGFEWEAQTKPANILKSLKIYLLLYFSSNLAQNFRKCSLHYKRKTLLVNLYNFKKQKFYDKN